MFHACATHIPVHVSRRGQLSWLQVAVAHATHGQIDSMHPYLSAESLQCKAPALHYVMYIWLGATFDLSNMMPCCC